MSRGRLDVVAAIVRDEKNQLLLSQRLQHKHQGGCWEFPGGKMDANESLHQALARELKEELGIRAHSSSPFMTIEHNYPDLSVRLHFRDVSDWDGEPYGREQQPVQWFSLASLAALEFPAANLPVVTALQLPDAWLVLPNDYSAHWREKFMRLALMGVQGVYLRGAVHRTEAELKDMVDAARQCKLDTLIRDDAVLAKRVGASGVHLSSAVAEKTLSRPDCRLVSVACHDEHELDHAAHLRADMVMLSPVNRTASHAHAGGVRGGVSEGMGWPRFAQLATGRPYSVYALGGMAMNDIDMARESGARGVAGISAFWPETI